MIRKDYFNPRDRQKWLELRNTYSDKNMLGGSDISCVIDANPWKSALELFYNMVGFTPVNRVTNQRMIWGIELEDNIAEMYQYYDFDTEDVVLNYEAGRKVNPVRRVNAIVTNDKYPYMFANIDRYLPDIDGIGEIKNIDGFILEAYKNKIELPIYAKCPPGVPPGYYAQLQQYLMIFEKKRGRFILNVDGNDLRVIEIDADPTFQDFLVGSAIDFGTRLESGKKIMEKYKLTDDRLQALGAIEPQVTDQDSYNKFRTQQLLALEQHRADRTVMGDRDILNIALSYMKAHAREKDAASDKTLAGNAIKQYLFAHGAETIDFGDGGKITFKKRLSVKLND